MPPSELGTRGTESDGFPNQFTGIGAGLEQPNHIARDLPVVVALDSPAKADDQLRAELLWIWSIDLNTYASLLVDLDVMNADRFLAKNTCSVSDAELPVVPLTGDEFTVQLALGQPVTLMGACMVDGVDTTTGAGETDSVPVDFDHFHSAFRQVIETGDRIGLRGAIIGSQC